MKTKNRHSIGKRISQLATLGEVIFHASDISNLWNIKNKNTLYKTLSRYSKLGIIYRIYKGLYSLLPEKDIDSALLGTRALHRFSYVSCESVLYTAGIINQPPRELTLVSNISKRFSIRENNYRSRKMREDFLLNNAGIYKTGKNGNIVKYASVERAVFDMLYFNPKKYLDAMNSKIIPWNKVREIENKIGYNVKKKK